MPTLSNKSGWADRDRKMLTYICVFLTDSEVLEVLTIESVDERAASSKAQSLCVRHKRCTSVQVWREGRKIAVFNPRTTH